MDDVIPLPKRAASKFPLYSARSVGAWRELSDAQHVLRFDARSLRCVEGREVVCGMWEGCRYFIRFAIYGRG